MGTRLTLGLLLVYGASFMQAAPSFGSLQSLVYEYEAEIKAQADLPSVAVSSFTLRGLLTIQTSDSNAVVQLRDITTNLYNGPVNDGDQPSSAYLPLQGQADELSRAFTVHFEDAVVTGLSGVDGEAEWVVNMKRSIASLLQLNTANLSNPAFYVKENGLHGPCQVDYTTHRENEVYVVRKFVDHLSCPGYTTTAWSNTPPVEAFCAAGQDAVVSSSSERLYKVKDDAGRYQIVEVDARGAVSSQPLKAKGELHRVLTRQVLRLKSSAALPSAAAAPTGAVTELTYRLPGADFSQGRAPMKQNTLVTLVKRALLEIADSFDKTLARDENSLHDERVPQTVYFLTLLERKALEDLVNEYLGGTSYQDDTLRNLFMEILPQVGTPTSLLLIRDLIVERRVDDELAVALLTYLPFFVRRPTEQLLAECAVFYALPDTHAANVRSAAVLSFATLVFKTCGKHCRLETQDAYVRKYLDLFTAATDYEQKMLYLEGLSNMEDGKVFEYLEPVIRSHPDSHIRFLAVWATMNKAAWHPEQVFQLYWPILSDRGATLEMRVAALTMLVVSKPSAGRFFALHWFMTTETEPRLRHFYYTTLQSLINTKDPCYSLMSGYAAQVLRLLPAPLERHWSTGNYIVDHANTDLGFGAMAQLFLISNQKTELPNVFYLVVGSHAVGQRYEQLSMYLKLEGVSTAVRERLLHIDPNNVNIPQLADLLRQMKAAPSSTEPLHLEVLIKKEGRVVMCNYLNQTTFHQLAELARRVQSTTKEFHLNLQTVDSTLLMERVLPTDLGTPALFLMSSTDVISFRANTSQVSKASTYALRNELELRFSSMNVVSLMLYNPVVDLWQAVQRTTSLKLVLPFNGNIFLDLANSKLKFNIVKRPDKYTGFIIHVRSIVFVRGVGATKRLHSHCDACQPIFTVTRGDEHRTKKELFDVGVYEIGARIIGEKFDCEHHSGFHALGAAIRTQNYHVFPASRPIVIAAHLLNCWLLASPPGSCGTEVKFTTYLTKEPTEWEGSAQLTSSDSRNAVHLTFAHKVGVNTIHSWDVNALCKRDGLFYHLTVNVVRNAQSKDMRTLCIDAKVKIPAYPTNKYLVKASDPLTADATFRWASSGDQSSCNGEDSNSLPVELSFVAETTEEQAAIAKAAQIWPFKACKNGNNANACHQAAHEMATLRKYSIALNYSEPLEPSLFFLGRGDDGRLIASIEVPTSEQVVFVTIGSDKLVLDTGRYWIEPFLVNTHYPKLQKAAMAFGLIAPTKVPS